ncbi:uncharacterized protein LOC134059344 [Sardina pilchardus]|uniref:uncharacterized protein LOC134059344 n=1 Tax=Sardina pilchardus TaxID=27697 RepID=UPI002E0FD22A
MEDHTYSREEPKRELHRERILKRERDKRHNKTRVNLGVAFHRWKKIMSSKGFKRDTEVACFLLDSHAGAGEVVVQLECLLQLFQRCFECCSACSIRKRREGRVFNVTQNCQQCQANRKWRSHEPEQTIRDPASNQEVAEETVLLSFGDSGTDEEAIDRIGDTESEEEDEVQVQDALSQRKDNEEDKEIRGLQYENSSKDSGHIKTEKEETVAISHVLLESIQEEEQDPRSPTAEAELAPTNTSMQVNDSFIHTPEATVNRLNGEKIVVKMEVENDVEVNVQAGGEDCDEGGIDVEEEENEQGEEELEMQDSDDEEYGAGDHEEDDVDWHPGSAGCSVPYPDKNSWSLRKSNQSEPEILLPLAWCSVCASGFKHDCFRQRHSRLYGCLKCGTKTQMGKDGEIAEVTATNNQGTCTNQESSTYNNQTVSDGDGHKSTCGSKQCLASDGSQESASANKQGLTSSNGNQEASSITDNVNVTAGGLHNDVQGQIHGSHTETTQNGHQEEASCRNPERAPDKENSRSLHIDKLAVLFKSLNDFKIHAMQWHGITEFRDLCTDCGKFINMVNRVDGGPSHICEHKAKPIICPNCGKGFATEIGLQTHINRIHNEKYILTCRYCLKAFKSPEDKGEHEESHVEELLKYHCPHCSLRFADRPSWCAHRKSHWPNGKHICEVCSKGFRFAGVLERHMAVHTGQRPYSCKLCDRSFNQPGHLKSHMRLHTGEKPFKCQDCGECFNHNVSLKNHIQRHHGPGAEEGNSRKGGKGRMRRKKRNS